MNEIVELEDVDLARIEFGEARADMLEQPAQLFFVIGADNSARLAAATAFSRRVVTWTATHVGDRNSRERRGPTVRAADARAERREQLPVGAEAMAELTPVTPSLGLSGGTIRGTKRTGLHPAAAGRAGTQISRKAA
jgi:hypothetical protein